MPGTTQDHDRAPGLHDREAADAVQQALSGLRLQGAIFLRGDYTEPWAYESLPAADATAILAPGADRVVLFHVVASGRCWIQTGESERHWAEAGDVIVLPYNDQHRMGGVEDAVLVPISALVQPPPWASLPVIRHGEGGSMTSVVCGYLVCSDPLFDPRLQVFPRAFVVRPTGAARQWVSASIEYAMQRTEVVTPEQVSSPTDVPQLLLAEVLKLHLVSAPLAQHGLLSALHDPVLAPALTVIHASPDVKWTVATLANVAVVSPSLLDERFRSVLGMAPIRYLAEWRMHVAAGLLASTDLGVAVVARRVGYEAEEAFSRAFKRHHGVSPSGWHRKGPASGALT